MADKIINKDVAVIIPLSNRDYFTESEKISLRHLEKHLPDYDKYFISNEKFEINRKGYKNKYFPLRFFGSPAAHNRLLINKSFYDSFEDYKYILIYHLDALVFSDQLLYWCDQGFDYIGPPWIKSSDLPWLSENAVGNGGFSLRKVASFQKILFSNKKRRPPENRLKELKGESNPFRLIKHLGAYFWLKLSPYNNIRTHLEQYANSGGNEDRFWWYNAQKYYPDFKFPTVDKALKFGFEASPKKCFEMNNYQLPFGCHAWEKFDSEFWKPYILKAEKKSRLQSLMIYSN